MSISKKLSPEMKLLIAMSVELGKYREMERLALSIESDTHHLLPNIQDKIKDIERLYIPLYDSYFAD